MIWTRGSDRIAELLARGHFERITGEAANGQFLVDEAKQRLRSARLLYDASDLVGAFEFAYEGARHATTALLTQQGLRSKTEGGHVAVCEAATAQFGEPFNFLNRMRQMRNMMEYPRGPESLRVQASVVTKALDYLAETIGNVEQMMPNLSIWQPQQR